MASGKTLFHRFALKQKLALVRKTKAVKAIPLQVLATRKLDKSPVWSEWCQWDGTIQPGWFYTDDLAAAREHLHKQGHLPRVAVTHVTRGR